MSPSPVNAKYYSEEDGSGISIYMYTKLVPSQQKQMHKLAIAIRYQQWK